MSVSTDGQICFGILFEEDTEFPWDIEHDGDIEAWWRSVNGYEPPFELYTSEGGYVNGVKPSADKITEYYAIQRKFMEEHPLPVEVVNYCSGDYPMYILAIPQSYKRNSRGYPEEIDFTQLMECEKYKEELINFCTNFDIIEGADADPKWYLSSYWG